METKGTEALQHCCHSDVLSNWLSVTICDSTRQSMHVQHNTEANSCNHCCSRKTIILLILSVFVALCIQHATHMRHIVICVLSGTQYFSTLSLCTEYNYLGSIFTKDGKDTKNIRHRVTQARKVTDALNGIWWSKDIKNPEKDYL